MYVLSVLLGLPAVALCVCPGEYYGTPPSQSAEVPDLDTYNAALKTLDIKAVVDDIQENILTNSQDCWPADTINGNTSYVGLFIRLGWHCSGSYRNTDGVGGCSGYVIRTHQCI